ncbi:MAG: YceI family protein [Saprospiraceae bacterium]|nr:YceI family protein [Saprospiraceae bacterium]
MKIVASSILILLFLPFWVTGQETYRITVSSLVIKGTSNVHKWEAKVNQLSGSTELIFEGDQLKRLAESKFDIPVKGIKSSKGNTMDNKMYQALKSDACANISFNLSSATLDATGSTLKSTGTLTVACASKKIDLVSTLKSTGSGQYLLSGSVKMKMTDFGIKPPTALLGAMVTGDDITIEYEVNLIKDKSNF